MTALSTSQKDALDYWIGGEDRDKDGVWTWATSGNPITYSNWWSNQGTLRVSINMPKPFDLFSDMKQDHFFNRYLYESMLCMKFQIALKVS